MTLLTITEVANRLNVSTSTVYSHTRDGSLLPKQWHPRLYDSIDVDNINKIRKQNHNHRLTFTPRYEYAEYALYQGDDYIMSGSIYDIAKHLNIKPQSVLYYQTPTYQKRTKNKARRLVRIDN